MRPPYRDFRPIRPSGLLRQVAARNQPGRCARRDARAATQRWRHPAQGVLRLGRQQSGVSPKAAALCSMRRSPARANIPRDAARKWASSRHTRSPRRRYSNSRKSASRADARLPCSFSLTLGVIAAFVHNGSSIIPAVVAGSSASVIPSAVAAAKTSCSGTASAEVQRTRRSYAKARQLSAIPAACLLAARELQPASRKQRTLAQAI